MPYNWSNYSTTGLEALLQKRPLLIHREDELGDTPMLYACRHGLISIVRVILTQTKKPLHKKNNGRGPLHYACLYEHEDIATLLIATCPNLVYKRSRRLRNTALHYACFKGNINIINMILEVDKNVLYAENINGKPAIHYIPPCYAHVRAQLVARYYAF